MNLLIMGTYWFILYEALERHLFLTAGANKKYAIL